MTKTGTVTFRLILKKFKSFDFKFISTVLYFTLAYSSESLAFIT